MLINRFVCVIDLKRKNLLSCAISFKNPSYALYLKVCKSVLYYTYKLAIKHVEGSNNLVHVLNNRALDMNNAT